MRQKIFTLFLCATFSVAAFAQQPSGVIVKATTAPVIDGVVDEVWADANVYDIDKPYKTEVPTIGEVGETTWQALWTSEGMYILIKVADDVFYPNYAVTPAGNNWEYDKPEIYFDVNYVLVDGIGGGGGKGHYQFAPGFTDGKNDGTAITEDNGVIYAFMVEEPTYIGEYFIPFSLLKDKDGVGIDKMGNIGFDVSVIDRDAPDPIRQRAVWANIGGVDESYANMDEAGIITFEGAEAGTDVETINLTGGSITENNGVLQIVAEVLPVDATNKALNWSVENTTGRANVNAKGELSALMDGEVIVTAAATDGSYVDASVTVTITGQLISLGEINIIKNPFFDDVTAGGTANLWGGWGGNKKAPMPQIADGVAVCTPDTVMPDLAQWQYQYNQTNLTALPNVDYEFKFKAWADADRIGAVDFEDTEANKYNRYGASTDGNAVGGRSEWAFNLTTEPAWYIYHVNFDQIIETTVQKVTFMFGQAMDNVYLDSIYLVNLADVALISEYTAVTEIAVTSAGDVTTISTDDGTLQMSAAVLPADALYTTVRWSVVNGTGMATIDAAGLLTAEKNGTVTVVATAKDDSGIKGMMEITLSGQVGVAQNSIKAVKVYPNPAVNELTVVLTANNAKVAIYNSVGKKIEEVIVNGTQHKFDVSRYAKGLYFVKANDTVVKFMK